jgi:hypothetical protein
MRKHLSRIFFRIVTDENSHTKLKQTNKNFSFEKNTKSLILKIENRKANHYSRI